MPSLLDLLVPLALALTLSASPVLHSLLKSLLRLVPRPTSTWTVLPLYLQAFALQSHLVLLLAGVALFHRLAPAHSARAFRLMLLFPGLLFADRLVIELWQLQRLLLRGETEWLLGASGRYLGRPYASLAVALLFQGLGGYVVGEQTPMMWLRSDGRKAAIAWVLWKALTAEKGCPYQL